jgi:hypothetical protein
MKASPRHRISGYRGGRKLLSSLSKRMLLVGSLVIVCVTAGLVGLASADIPNGSQIPDSAVPISPFTAGTPFSSGQTISVVVPTNTVLPAHQDVVIAECAAPDDVIPTLTSACDTATATQQTIFPSGGAIDYKNFQVFALPDVYTLGESPTGQPVCDLTDECVLYIGNNVEDFTQPHFWSQGFFVSPNATDDGVDPGDGSAPAAAAAVSPTLSTVMASTNTPVGDGTDQSTITVTLNGTNSADATVPVPDAPVSLTQGSGHSVITTTPTTTNSSGVATFTVTDPTPEQVTYTATSGSVTVNQTADVTFEAPAVSAANSSAVPSTTTVPNLSDTATVTVTALDQGASPVPLVGQTVTLTPDSGSSSLVQPTSQKTGPGGTATFTVSDTAAEVVTYTAVAGGVTLTSKPSITFGTLTVSASSSTVVATSSTAVTGSSGGTTVTVTLLNAGGVSPVGGKGVVLTATGSATVSPTTAVVTGSNGRAQFTVTDAVDESATFTATDQTDSNLVIGSTSVAFVAPTTVSPTASTVTYVSSNPPTVTTPADGTSPFNVFVTIKNYSNNVVAGDIVSLAPATPDVKLLITPDTEAGSSTPGATGSDGVAEFQVRDTVAESVTLTAVDTTSNVTLTPSSPISLTFTSGSPDGNQSTTAANPTTVAADGTTSSTITVNLQDHFGNPVTGDSITLNQGGGKSVITPSSATTNASGVATFTVTDTTNEVVAYTAVDTDDGNLAISQLATVTFGTPPPDVPTTGDSTIVANYSSVPADGQTAASVSVILMDDNGLPVSGRTVTLTASGGSSKISPATQTSDENGIATFAITDTAVESVTYTAADTSDSVPVYGSVTISFVAAQPVSSSSAHLNAPIVGMAATPDGGGYWLVASDGGVFTYGDATFYGSAGGIHLNAPIVGMAATSDGGGYWLVASDGGVFAYGDANFYGSAGGIHLNDPIVGMAASPDDGGYWLVASDGGVFNYGSAAFHGSAGNIALNRPVVGMAATADGGGYWLVATDGGIFSYGDATFYGSTGDIHLNKPIVGMASAQYGQGYWLVASDGGIFAFGDAIFDGSTGNTTLNSPVVDMTTTPQGDGYWMTAGDGGVFNFGGSKFYGSAA